MNSPASLSTKIRTRCRFRGSATHASIKRFATTLYLVSIRASRTSIVKPHSVLSKVHFPVTMALYSHMDRQGVARHTPWWVHMDQLSQREASCQMCLIMSSRS